MNAVDTNGFVYALDADEPVKQPRPTTCWTTALIHHPRGSRAALLIGIGRPCGRPGHCRVDAQLL